MRSIKTSKMAVVGLLMVVVVGFAQATKPRFSPLEVDVEQKLCIKGSYPKVGEIFEVVYRVRLKPGVQPRFGNKYWIRFTTGTYNPAEIIDKDEIFVPSLVPGEWKEFHGRFRIPKAYSRIIIGADITYAAGTQRSYCVGTRIDLYLLDPVTGQYGTKEEYAGELPVEYRYDFIDGSFIGTYDQTRVSLEENRRIINMIKEFEPSLSDSLSLVLHSEQYRVGVPKGVPQWDSLNQKWIDKGVYEYYLKDGWLKAVQEGKIEQWRENEKQKIERSWKEGRLNFFRPADNWSGRDLTAHRDTFYKACDGIWKFKDHLYDKDQGLLAEAVKKGIKQGRARVLTTYVSGGLTCRILTHQSVTNDTGYFSVTIKLPDDATLAKAWAIIYPCGGGSDTASPKINVSDPTPTSAEYNKDPIDPTLYVIKNLYYNNIYPNAESVHFNVVYADTYPEVAQPQSGCINIYETYLHARTFMFPPPDWPLRVMWEPGYDTATAYYPTGDTIKVIGEPNAPIEDTDEWDDDVLLHEFGHYLMNNYAQLQPTVTDTHWWYKAYPNDTCLAYKEGWATFFSGRARVNSGTDSLYVDTKKGINGNLAGWYHLENPWIISGGIPTDSFVGGPWCEGAVAGVLWDIYDSYNEIPYDSFPDSLNGVWFPDTALADSLTMGFDEIWNIFDNYDPVGQADTNCQTIFQFRSGWNYYNCNHAFALNQILLHHRIRDSIPAAPLGLQLFFENGDIRLFWLKNLEPDLYGYRIYRRDNSSIVLWTQWSLMSELTDTTYLDTLVQAGFFYEYKLTAFDSLTNESGFSDSVNMYVPQPPLAPYIVQVEKSGADIILTWSKVSTDTLGNPLSVEYYVVYRDTTPNYVPESADSIGCVLQPDTVYVDVGAINTAEDYYYLIKAVDIMSGKMYNDNDNTYFIRK